ncbi:hypothetical protein C9374_006569 [Naegleria lovaniensis]|uniref:F-box domain-containing protein n=1 Tax=Naegleria lovaniensis TaxID=51637 RepID=A0AA88KGS8_NAELO|nr:uncharacterized protein C9374_006569 [Naegleria lovaniensis]KAG2379452.1 hypothetical protein C9374_006569 [Naegleria lovaniensis]
MSSFTSSSSGSSRKSFVNSLYQKEESPSPPPALHRKRSMSLSSQMSVLKSKQSHNTYASSNISLHSNRDHSASIQYSKQALLSNVHFTQLVTNTFQALPHELQCYIFTFLSGNYLFKSGRLVCRTWRDLIREFGIFSGQLCFTVYSPDYERDRKKDLKRIEIFIKCCKEGYFTQLDDLQLNFSMKDQSVMMNALFLDSGMTGGISPLSGNALQMNDSVFSNASPSSGANILNFQQNSSTQLSPRQTSPRRRQSKNLTSDILPRKTQPYFPSLTKLQIKYQHPFCKTLATSSYLTSLKHLNLNFCRLVTDSEVKELAQSEFLTKLETLQLQGTSITDEGVKYIASSSTLIHLTCLDIGGNFPQMGLESFFSVLTSKNFGTLKNFEFQGNRVKYENIAMPLTSQTMNSTKVTSPLSLQNNSSCSNPFESKTSLRHLNLYRNFFGKLGAQFMAQHATQFFQHLTYLNMTNNYIEKEGMKYLCECQQLSNLTYLEAGYNNIGDEGAKYIATAVFAPNLTQLFLVNNNIGVEGVKALSDGDSSQLTNVLELSLSNFDNESNNKIGDEGALALARSRVWKQLKKLSIRKNQIGERGVLELSQSEFLHHLEELDLRYNNASLEAIEAANFRVGSRNLLHHQIAYHIPKHKKHKSIDKNCLIQ